MDQRICYLLIQIRVIGLNPASPYSRSNHQGSQRTKEELKTYFFNVTRSYHRFALIMILWGSQWIQQRHKVCHN